VRPEGHAKIVLACANEGEWVRLTVESLLENTEYPSFEVVISANGDQHTDFSFVDLPACRGRVSLRESREFLGCGGARNAGVEPGDAEYYVFLDAHSLVEDRNWLERAVACLDAHPEASMVQPEVNEFTFPGTPAPGEPLDPSCLRRLPYCEYSVRWAWPYGEPHQLTEPMTRRAGPMPWEAMAGAGMASFMRAETFHRLGRFDGEVRGWFHETMDYCVRAWLLGFPMLSDPSVRVLHLRKTQAVRYPRDYISMFHGLLRAAYKYLSPRRMDLAEVLLRRHGRDAEVDQALDLVEKGNWLAERAAHAKARLHDDDWLFAKFGVYEEPFAG
jgi:GT2 family glycosyltransferase